MKKIKKLAGLCLALTLTFAFGAFAACDDSDTSSSSSASSSSSSSSAQTSEATSYKFKVVDESNNAVTGVSIVLCQLNGGMCFANVPVDANGTATYSAQEGAFDIHVANSDGDYYVLTNTSPTQTPANFSDTEIVLVSTGTLAD